MIRRSLLGLAVLPTALARGNQDDADAQPVSTSFAEYMLPTAVELPRIELMSLISPSPLNPLGVKGVGEYGVIPAAAAIVSAIEDALRPLQVPVGDSARQIFLKPSALQLRRSSSATSRNCTGVDRHRQV